MNFPRLFKKTSTGAIQFWKIWTEESNQGFGMYPCIITEYGQVGTNSPQTTYDHIKEGKNTGKVNETNPFEQADAEAKAKWEKRKKHGYVESIEAAEKDELDDLIEGGIVPMLAHSFSKHGHKIKYPCYAQPKFDGIRCIAIFQNGRCTLWSRTRKPITSCPHIIKEIENQLSKHSISKDEALILDGELYSHLYRNNFEHIVHLVRQEEPDPQHTDVQYHIYDLVNDKSFKDRMNDLHNLIKISDPLFPVQTVTITEEGVSEIFNFYKDNGYEGAMLRNMDGLYVNKRSYDLQKVKEFEDSEFKIIGVEEGRGKLSGHVGAFVCVTKDGTEFKAKMSGDTDRLKEYFENEKLWKNQLLTIQYQGLTGKSNVPRFPVGLRIRDYE